MKKLNRAGEMLFDVQNLVFGYTTGSKDKTNVINNVSVAIHQGSFTGIIGPNGCGKTTLLDLLVKHLKAESGEILYLGENICDYSVKAYSKEIALVSQNFYINFNYTVEEIVMMGRHPYISRFSAPSETDYAIVENAMKEADILHYKDSCVTRLSGGERQRVVFARALAQETPVLILDEATSNLDIRHTLSLMNLVSGNVKKMNQTVISVFQDINLASMYCDNLIFLKNGTVVESGRTDDILNSEMIKTVFNVESKIVDDPFSNSRIVAFKR